jgi:hypothetical protein
MRIPDITDAWGIAGVTLLIVLFAPFCIGVWLFPDGGKGAPDLPTVGYYFLVTLWLFGAVFIWGAIWIWIENRLRPHMRWSQDADGMYYRTLVFGKDFPETPNSWRVH